MSRILCVDNIIRVLPGGTRLISPLSFEGSSGESIFVQASEIRREALFDILSGLSKPDTGRVLLCGEDLYDRTEEETAQLRCRNIGAVPARIRFLPELGTVDNIALPQVIAGVDPDKAAENIKQQSSRIVSSMILEQKVASLTPFARALTGLIRAAANTPKLLLLDDFMCELDEKDLPDIWYTIHEIRPKDSLLIYMSSTVAPENYVWTQEIRL